MGVGDGELCPWASTHRGKWGQLTPLDNGYEKLKSENMQKTAVFYVYVIFREQSGQAGVENGAVLTTYSYILQNAGKIHWVTLSFADTKVSKFSPRPKVWSDT